MAIRAPDGANKQDLNNDDHNYVFITVAQTSLILAFLANQRNMLVQADDGNTAATRDPG